MATPLVDAIRTKGAFYFLRRQFDSIIRTHGLNMAYREAFALYHSLADGGVRPNMSADDFDFLRTIMSDMPAGSFYRVSVASLANGNWPGSMAATIAALTTGEPLPAALNAIVPSGPSAGHPAWHILNPYFHLWRDAALTPGSTPQDTWAGDPAVAATAPVMTEVEYIEWCRAPDLERAALYAFVKEKRPASMIDLGCGNGRLLRYAVDNFEPVSAFYGVELHENRVDAAMQLVSRTQQPSYSCSIAARNLLSGEALPQAELAALFRAAGSFDDAQLRIVLGLIADSGTQWIFEAEVLSRWDAWRGRPEPEALFASAGWKLHSSDMIGDPITAGEARFAVMPSKYWCARAVRIWGRA